MKCNRHVGGQEPTMYSYPRNTRNKMAIITPARTKEIRAIARDLGISVIRR